MKILFLVPYPTNQAPSQRFRFEQYFQHLQREGHQYTISAFLTSQNWQVFYSSGKIVGKIATLALGFTKRIIDLVRAISYDFVFIHREASPIGPPVFEWLLANLLRKKIIYDFDDAIWTTDNQFESSFQRWIRWRSKVSAICSWSHKVSCGNNYLCDYAKQFNTQVVLNPTTIDSEFLHNPNLSKKETSKHLIIGWTGSHSTLKYLKVIEPVLLKLEAAYADVRILIIADRKPNLNLPRLDFLKWNKENEAIDLQRIHIGIMPLPDDDWAKGKCGFKALQYMAMEIPTVASSVGVNTTIVEHGINGLLATTHEEWYEAISSLIKDSALRKKMGESGRKKIINHYSVTSNSSNFLSLFL